MNLSMDVHNFSMVNVHFLDTKRNMIMDGNFTKVIYSNQYFVMNSIYLYFPIDWATISKGYETNKCFVRFNPYSAKNLGIIQDIAKIEMRILDYFKSYFDITLKSNHLLSKQMYSGNMKIFQEYGTTPRNENALPSNDVPILPDPQDPKTFVIKISGVWESYDEIGITYKLLQAAGKPTVSPAPPSLYTVK